MAVLMVAVICSIIIQVFFMPPWEDGNLNVDGPASDGVHTQTNREFNKTEQRKDIHITN